MRKLFLAMLVTVLAACVQSAPHVGKFAGVAVVTQNGKPINAVVLGLAATAAKCEADMKAAVAALGAPPPGVTAELSCVELVPFETLTSESTVAPHVSLKVPHTDSI